MKIIKMIKLNDGNIYSSKDIATRDIFDNLSKGKNLEVFENIAQKNTLEIRSYFIDNHKEIERILDLVKELHEVTKVNF
jgi:hypothetical protein